MIRKGHALTKSEKLTKKSLVNPLEAFLCMFMPYIEDPKINWTINDSLYNRLLKWKLKCKNILECELAMLAERRKCKKVIP